MANGTVDFTQSIDIHADRARVWQVVTGQDTYRQWTKVFCPTSRYEGEWALGNTVHFLGDDNDGNIGGMASKVIELEPNEHIKFEHFGMIGPGGEIVTDGEHSEWFPSHEAYSLEDIEGGTRMTVEQDLPADQLEMFSNFWKEALAEVKRLAEG